MHNPSLRATPREQHAPIIDSTTDSSILSWLEGTGRLMERDIVVDPHLLEDDMDELSGALLGSDDTDYDDDDEDLED
ncbi:MAG: DUF3134 family protein [Thermosynechococcaceae cyanobacterium]